MNYKTAIDRLKVSQELGSRLGLDRMRALAKELGNPQDDLKIIHVAGTNGKGSVCTYLTNILKENGYTTGTFLSPYLESPLDSILLSGQEITEEEFLEAAKVVFAAADSLAAKIGEQATEFELLTAIAFTAFKNKSVDFVVLEVGLGGREDATNIIKTPIMSVITSIAIDHMGILGDSLEMIASEKAGIIKKACTVVTNVSGEEAQTVIQAKAREMASPLFDASCLEAFDIEKDIRGYSFTIDKRAVDGLLGPVVVGAQALVGERPHAPALRVKLAMAGDHQISNSICAIFTVNQLAKMGIISIDFDKLLKALAQSKQKGRLEVIGENPLILADGAHNVEGIKALKRTVKEHFSDKNILLVLGMIKGKEAELMVDELCSLGGTIVTTEPENSLRFRASKLCKIVRKSGCDCKSLGPMGEAMAYVKKIKQDYDVVIITGSLYLAGKVRGHFNNG